VYIFFEDIKNSLNSLKSYLKKLTLTDIKMAKFRYKMILIYGLSLAVLLFYLKWIEIKFLIWSKAYDIYIGLIALFFTLLGIWLAKNLNFKKQGIVEHEGQMIHRSAISFESNKMNQVICNISNRELEVLQLMANGMSNIEIANELFVSVNTIKNHPKV